MLKIKLKKEIIDKIFPEELLGIEFFEKKYPPRKLTGEAMVTRMAPSPTGFMHIGGIYTALISERLAHQSGGIFYLRIEDTDKKREVEGASSLVVSSLNNYGIIVDEGEKISGEEVGDYGPYKQSERELIYKAHIKYLLENGLAYPCFASSEELEEMRGLQEAQKIRPGYYGRWATWRDRSEEDIEQALNSGKGFVIRFRADGDIDRKITVDDLLLGKRDLPENDQDVVIMKSDGLPTYHLAHVVDDHYMRTTHVIRGNEWFPSLSLHLQLFEAFGWQPPRYGHIFPIQKKEGSSKRKLSKRKDPEAGVSYYEEAGYPREAVIEYLLNLANSNFEEWRKANPLENNRKFEISIKKLLGSNGPLFDIDKLNDISKDIISRYDATTVYNNLARWAEKLDAEFARILKGQPEYSIKVLDIERSGTAKPRKDIGKWSDAREEIGYFFDQIFIFDKNCLPGLISDIALSDIIAVASSFVGIFNEKDTSEEWFEKIKKIARDNGFADNVKAHKENPGKYKGSIADVAKIFRVLLTLKTRTPDLYLIMKAMGRETIDKRLSIQ
jgi:glutamyl-tRNA synthetase